MNSSRSIPNISRSIFNLLTEINMPAVDQSYLSQLRELYSNCSKQEVADALGVTLRQVQNYLKGEKAPTPGQDVQLKIRESFANYKEGQPLIKRQDDGEWKSKYITALERENARLQRDLDINLAELRNDILLQRALSETTQDMLVELLAKQRKAPLDEVAYIVSTMNGERFQALKAGDNASPAGRQNKG